MRNQTEVQGWVAEQINSRMELVGCAATFIADLDSKQKEVVKKVEKVEKVK